jgi:hypothetical protein
MTERELQDALVSLVLDLVELQDDEDPDEQLADHLPGVADAGTFADRGLLSGNKGVVLTFEDGSEFQITIVRSR